jgi:hypothetical protein
MWSPIFIGREMLPDATIPLKMRHDQTWESFSFVRRLPFASRVLPIDKLARTVTFRVGHQDTRTAVANVMPVRVLHISQRRDLYDTRS